VTGTGDSYSMHVTPKEDGLHEDTINKIAATIEKMYEDGDRPTCATWPKFNGVLGKRKRTPNNRPKKMRKLDVAKESDDDVPVKRRGRKNVYVSSPPTGASSSHVQVIHGVRKEGTPVATSIEEGSVIGSDDDSTSCDFAKDSDPIYDGVDASEENKGEPVQCVQQTSGVGDISDDTEDTVAYNEFPSGKDELNSPTVPPSSSMNSLQPPKVQPSIATPGGVRNYGLARRAPSGVAFMNDYTIARIKENCDELKQLFKKTPSKMKRRITGPKNSWPSYIVRMLGWTIKKAELTFQNYCSFFPKDRAATFFNKTFIFDKNGNKIFSMKKI